ncbi:MAG: hypothetical protein LAN64_14670 [Acidobacteriia bacterium]|nr:hypothetical protein [Terriglobia bacterium]
MTGQEAPTQQGGESRSYPSSDVKLLFGLSAGRCNEPTCFAEVLVNATQFDKAVVVGKIAHIEAHSDKGPRANPNLTKKERDCYLNWILLCGYHHDIVDAQDCTYTSELLLGWKRDHERRINDALGAAMPLITYAELAVVTAGVALSIAGTPAADLHVTAPAAKMEKNKLTGAVQHFLLLALGKAPDVKRFVEHYAKVDPEFPERLKAGLANEYARLHSGGDEGDRLFEALMWYAAGGRMTDLRHMAAGLAVLGYYFMICEVFEK